MEVQIQRSTAADALSQQRHHAITFTSITSITFTSNTFITSITCITSRTCYYLDRSI
jgi:hypothetical protein